MCSWSPTCTSSARRMRSDEVRSLPATSIRSTTTRGPKSAASPSSCARATAPAESTTRRAAAKAARGMGPHGSIGRERPRMPNRRTIVYIEDNQANMDLVTRVLEATGKYRVVGAFEGGEGLETFLRERPALLLVDLDVPVMNGFEI